jgi:hypothetical protein
LLELVKTGVGAVVLASADQHFTALDTLGSLLLLHLLSLLLPLGFDAGKSFVILVSLFLVIFIRGAIRRRACI